jgi:ABC-2 type transport system permease protein
MSREGIATVARQEFKLRIRAGRWKLLLGAFFGVLALVTLLLSSAVSTVVEEDLRYRGTVVFGGLMLFVLGLALLVVPSLSAQSVNGDRERGTLAVLQVTRLSPGDIVLGKFLAAWGTALVFLALTLPFIGYSMTQNGVPLVRVVAVLAVVGLLLGTVCAVSLWLSAVLARTTTSGVLAYLVVFALSVGTVIVFGLATALTTERYTESFTVECGPDFTEEQGCVPGPQSYVSTRTRTDRTWWLLSPNPFVVLADAAPALPEEDEPEDGRPGVVLDGDVGQRAQDVDPLGQLGQNVRDLRREPDVLTPDGDFAREEPPSRPVWPYGLAFDVLLGAGALVLTTRRLHTPTRTLPKGQRVA